MSKSFYKGWNSALRTVAEAMASRGIEESDTLRVLHSLIKRPRHSHRSDSLTAHKYGISKRTVLNWRKDGCPFNKGQWAVLDWMAGRRYLPEKAEQKFKKQLTKRRLRAMLVRLDDTIIDTQAVAKLHRNLGLPVEPWMKMKRVTRRKVAAATAQAEQEIRQRLAGLE